MDLRLYFAATKRHFAVLGLTSNMVVNKHSDFLAFGFLTDVDVIGTLGMLSVTPYGVYIVHLTNVTSVNGGTFGFSL